jgi:hypothetical protein
MRGKPLVVRVRQHAGEVRVTGAPPGINLVSQQAAGPDWVIEFAVGDDAVLHAPQTIRFEAEGRDVDLSVRVFGPREFFVVLVLEANYHDGWDPRVMAQFYDELAGSNRPLFRKNAGLQGEGVRGTAFRHLVGDPEEMHKYPEGYWYEPLERIVHTRGFPITWLVDGAVASEFHEVLGPMLQEHGDSFGYLPSSFFYQNHTSYNYTKSMEETTQALRATAAGVEDALGHYSNVCGIDQWVGGVGTHWVAAARALGLEGIWGMGWDHRECDTSMYHRGAPWNAYKPSLTQFRRPLQPGEAGTLWAFQWTVRDLVNTLPLSPHGSVCFSTDPDDVRSQGILQRERSPTYFLKLLREYHNNWRHERVDHFVFLVHQEDHDSHIQEDNEYLALFLDEVATEIGRGEAITVATLDEVAAWLNLRYDPDAVNEQFLQLHDPLTPTTRAAIQEKYFDTIARIYDPDTEEEIQALLDRLWPAECSLGPVFAYFGQDALWLIQYPSRTPQQYYAYGDPAQESVDERGELVQRVLPTVTLVEESLPYPRYRLVVDADQAMTAFPWAYWRRGHPGEVDFPAEAAHTAHRGFVLLLDLQPGRNTFEF